jgi:hypothetical protein
MIMGRPFATLPGGDSPLPRKRRRCPANDDGANGDGVEGDGVEVGGAVRVEEGDGTLG